MRLYLGKVGMPVPLILIMLIPVVTTTSTLRCSHSFVHSFSQKSAHFAFSFVNTIVVADTHTEVGAAQCCSHVDISLCSAFLLYFTFSSSSNNELEKTWVSCRINIAEFYYVTIMSCPERTFS